jgi:HlyD family secretion protein
VPIQAVVERDPSQLNPPAKGAAQAAALTAQPEQKPEQGVFVIRNNEAVFVPVATGVTGVDHVQIQSGLQPGDQVVTGPYKALRTMKNHARIKVDNTVVKPATTA